MILKPNVKRNFLAKITAPTKVAPDALASICKSITKINTMFIEPIVLALKGVEVRKDGDQLRVSIGMYYMKENLDVKEFLGTIYIAINTEVTTFTISCYLNVRPADQAKAAIIYDQARNIITSDLMIKLGGTSND